MATRAAQWRVAHFTAGLVLALCLIAAEDASAEIADAGANGFTLREAVHVEAAPDKVYAALAMPRYWWSSDHTFSGSAANLTLDAHAGGCWCETLADGGSVLHMTVVYAAPGKLLRMRGALGPFQAMAADGVMAWSLTANDGGTDVTFTYSVVGYAKDSFDKIAHGADGVLAEQVERLKTFVETGASGSHR